MNLLNKLSTKITACIKRENIPFILGGSRDVFYASAQAVSQMKKKTLHIIIRSKIDTNDKQIDIITQSNSLSRILAISDFQ
jgi:arginase family enzyme